jgi:hypothetical protein
MDAAHHAVETVKAEIAGIVAHRQELRSGGATTAELEQNREHLLGAQARLSRLLIKLHLGHAAA